MILKNLLLHSTVLHFLWMVKAYNFIEPLSNSIPEASYVRNQRSNKNYQHGQKGRVRRLIESPEVDINSLFAGVIRAVPGLKEDSITMNHCTGIPLQMYQRQVDSGRACRHHTDYRCFKACQFEKLGISLEGTINTKKLFAHVATSFIGQRPPSIEAMKKAAFECFVQKSNTDILSSTNCEVNNVPLECILKKYFEICKPGDTVPALKNNLA